MTHLRKHYGLNRWRMSRFRFRANQRAAKKRIGIERASRDEPMPDVSHVATPRPPAALARVRIYFRDGTSAGFSIHETPSGLSISPTLAGRKITSALINFQPKQQ